EIFPPKSLFLPPIAFQHIGEQPTGLLFGRPSQWVRGYTCRQLFIYWPNPLLEGSDGFSSGAFFQFWALHGYTSRNPFTTKLFEQVAQTPGRAAILIIVLFDRRFGLICNSSDIVAF